MDDTKTCIVWFQHDLRLADNPALNHAVTQGAQIVPVYIWSPEEEGQWKPGGASRWWLHNSLQSLASALEQKGVKLIIRQGPILETLSQLIRETKARMVVWNKRFEPGSQHREARIMRELSSAGIECRSFNAGLLFEPDSVKTKTDNKGYKVFTAFWKQCLTQVSTFNTLPEPGKLTGPSHWPASLPAKIIIGNSTQHWAEGFRTLWAPGENGATRKLENFKNRCFKEYEEQRNRTDHQGTSQLSPHLHFGEIGPRQIWNAVRSAARKNGISEAACIGSQFLAEIGWREFAHHLLHYFPKSDHESMRPEFQHFPWRTHESALKAWQQGLTGYPIVDAGMRELWHTGGMHNRARMITGSFLTKDLLLDWRCGAEWFWDTLVDADLAANTLNWQWVAGCGADAAPFFRIFNPVLQGAKFDPDGNYVRRWVPELRGLPAEWIHRPWEAPDIVLSRAGITLDKTYPRPIISHSIAREIALEAYHRTRQKK